MYPFEVDSLYTNASPAINIFLDFPDKEDYVTSQATLLDSPRYLLVLQLRLKKKDGTTKYRTGIFLLNVYRASSYKCK